MKLLFGLVSSLMLLAGGPAPVRSYYVDVPYTGPESVREVAELGFDVGGINLEQGTITLVVPESALPATRSVDVRAMRKIAAPDEKFRTPDEIEAALRDIEQRYPHLASVEVIGKSVEGRDILAVHLTSRFVSTGEEKPAILFDAMHHAREVMTPEVALDIIDWLTKNYGRDEKAQKWLDKYSVWVVPMVNPDGNGKVWETQPMWRKNTQGGYGVDVNRNYPYAWNTCNGSSGSKSSDTYRGPSPGSEPETQALMELAKRIRPKFNISYHSYSEIVIYPYGCSPKKIPQPDRDIYEGIGKELAKRLVRDSGTGTYTAGTSYELLYNVDGGSVDWMYEMDKIMSFVIEVNSSSQGFQPSFDKWREKTVERQRAGWQYILEKMDAPGIKPD